MNEQYYILDEPGTPQLIWCITEVSVLVGMDDTGWSPSECSKEEVVNATFVKNISKDVARVLFPQLVK